jgi:hypothetical protein
MQDNIHSAIARAKACDYRPQRTFAWSKVYDLFGPKPVDLTEEELSLLSEEELSARQTWHHTVAAFIEGAPKHLLWVETRVLYNVSPDLTGDFSGLWGDAAGLTGRVNPGTIGNVTGLIGSLESLWGDVSNIFGRIHTHLYGTVTNLMGDITGKWGYCSMVRGDVTGLRQDLTFLEGNLTGFAGDRYSLAKQPTLLAKHGVRIVQRELRNHPRANVNVGNWMRTWGDGSRATGVNTGVVGDVSNVVGDLTGQRFDTAFVPALPDVPVNQVILPREGSVGLAAA